MSIYELFGEYKNVEEIISLILSNDFKDAEKIDDELDCAYGRHKYSTLTFKYKGKRYSIQYKEHISDDVADVEYLYDTFTSPDDEITSEALKEVEDYYEEKIKSLNEQVESLNEYKAVMDTLNSVSTKYLNDVGRMLVISGNDSHEPDKEMITVGEFLSELSKMRDANL